MFDDDVEALSLIGGWTPVKKGVAALLEALLLGRLLSTCGELVAEARLALGVGDNHDGVV